MCMDCARRLEQRSNAKCPICRGPIQRLQTIFLTGVSGDGKDGSAEEPPAADGSIDQDGETKEDEFDRKFIIKNDIRAFAPIGTRGVADEIVASIRDIPQFNWVKNGLTGNFESTLSSATRGDVQHIRQRLQEKGLSLELINDTGDTKVYEIKSANDIK
jgi:hypothetical protein